MGHLKKRAFIVIPFFVILLLAAFFSLLMTPPENKPDLQISSSSSSSSSSSFSTPPLPRLALIIDDGGYNTEAFKGMMRMGKPMTFAILPNTPHAREAALMAHQNGSEVILHLPMEPKEGEQYSLERDTVLTGMDAEKIQKILQDDLKQIPYVRGVNNHMGSKATEEPKVMQPLMEVLRKEKLYFIDSHTSSRTLGPEMARRAGVAHAQNYKFIDYEKDKETIKETIRSAMRKAKREGKAVAIGHPHPLTAQAIKEMIPEIEREGIRLVFASEVVG